MTRGYASREFEVRCFNCFKACNGSLIVSCVGEREALFISGIRAYEISDDVTKLYALRTISDVVTRCDLFTSRIHASVVLSI
jgi:hypothetical protein